MKSGCVHYLSTCAYYSKAKSQEFQHQYEQTFYSSILLCSARVTLLDFLGVTLSSQSGTDPDLLSCWACQVIEDLWVPVSLSVNQATNNLMGKLWKQNHANILMQGLTFSRPSRNDHSLSFPLILLFSGPLSLLVTMTTFPDGPIYLHAPPIIKVSWHPVVLLPLPFLSVWHRRTQGKMGQLWTPWLGTLG